MPSMPTHTRKDRLKLLINEYGSISAFGKRYGFDATYLSQMLNGHRSVGEKTARKIESATGKPAGWLDGLDSQSNIAPVQSRPALPLIDIVKAGDWCQAEDPYPVGAAEDYRESPPHKTPSNSGITQTGNIFSKSY